mgnify:CR=1 FL=1
MNAMQIANLTLKLEYLIPVIEKIRYDRKSISNIIKIIYSLIETKADIELVDFALKNINDYFSDYEMVIIEDRLNNIINILNTEATKNKKRNRKRNARKK